MSAPPASSRRPGREPGRRPTRPAQKRRGRLRRLIATLHDWAESGWAGTATGTWGLMQGSVVPGPSDILLVPLGLADPPRVFRLAAWATAGAAVGGLIAYAIGALAFETVGQWLIGLFGVGAARVQEQRARFDEHGAWLVALSAISPLPTKIVCMAAGAFGVPVPAFFLAILTGRAVRFVGIAAIVRIAGQWLARRLRIQD